MNTPDHFHHYLIQLRRLDESVSKDESDEREIKKIIDICRRITADYIKLLHNRKIKEKQLAEYIKSKVTPIIEYIESYLIHTTPMEKLKFKNYLTELLITVWLEVDRNYWEEEMNKLVGSAVKYGEVDLDNLEDLAKRTDKDMFEAKITDYAAGLTSDMEDDRWTIHNFDYRKTNKKETPQMEEGNDKESLK
jgi:hypothetical protein